MVAKSMEAAVEVIDLYHGWRSAQLWAHRRNNSSIDSRGLPSFPRSNAKKLNEPIDWKKVYEMLKRERWGEYRELFTSARYNPDAVLEGYFDVEKAIMRITPEKGYDRALIAYLNERHMWDREP